MNLKAFLFGITVAIAIGPIAVLIIRYGIVEGWRTSVASGIGAALADFTFALVAFTLGSLVLQYLSSYQKIIQYTSSTILILFGFRLAWHSYFCASKEKSGPNNRKRNPFLMTYFLTIINPLTIIVFLGFIGQVERDISLSQAVTLALYLFMGSLLIQLVYALGGSGLGALVKNQKIICCLNIFSGLGIAIFGISSLARFFV